jgi:hypothetical protein
MDTGGQSTVTDKSFSRKRSSQFNCEECMQQLMENLSVADKRLPDCLNIAHNKALRNNGK